MLKPFSVRYLNHYRVNESKISRCIISTSSIRLTHKLQQYYFDTATSDVASHYLDTAVVSVPWQSLPWNRLAYLGTAVAEVSGCLDTAAALSNYIDTAAELVPDYVTAVAAVSYCIRYLESSRSDVSEHLDTATEQECQINSDTATAVSEYVDTASGAGLDNCPLAPRRPDQSDNSGLRLFYYCDSSLGC